MKTRQKKKPEANYFSYLDLDFDDARLFMASGLGNYIAPAYKQLFGSDVLIDWNNYSDLKKTLNLKDISKALYTYLKYILQLIGKHSNSKFGTEADQQHNFFQRSTEQDGFFTYLFMASQMEKRTVLAKKSRRIKSELPVPFLGKAHLDLKMREGKDTFKFTAAETRLTEKQLYAIGTFYMINFIFDALKQGDALRLMRLINNMHHFQSGPSYLAAYGKSGGKKTAARRNSKKEQGYQIFLDCKIHETHGPKATPMVAALMPQLRRRKIKISEKTVETKWMPEYVKRIQLTEL